MKKKLLILLGVIATVIIAGSGWAYSFIKSRQNINDLELAELSSSFTQQYGADTTIKQLISQDKVYAALWIDKDNVTHVSWNIGSLWVTVYNSQTTTTP